VDDADAVADIVDEKGEGMTGLTDRGTFRMKTKNDRSREETHSSWSVEIVVVNYVMWGQSYKHMNIFCDFHQISDKNL
jgi:hypothetical protein